MFRRRPVGPARRGPGLLGTMARTAVVAGTAKATVGAVGNRQQRKQQECDEAQQAAAQQQETSSPQEAQPAVAMPAGGGGGGGGNMIAELQKLSSLKDSGVLTESEFTAAKAKLLA